MPRYAILLGNSPVEGRIQKKLLDFKRFLQSDSGGSWGEREILVCNNAVPAFFTLMEERFSGYGMLLLYSCEFGKSPRALPAVNPCGTQVLTLCDCGTELVGEEEALTM